MLPVSLEALEDLALRIRAVHVQLARAVLDGRPEPLIAMPDATRLARAYALARAEEDALGVLVAEAVAMDALRVPGRAYDAAWTREPIVLPRESPVAVRGLADALTLEGNAARRSVLADAGDARAKDHLGTARSLVDASRTIATTLGLDAPVALHGALGVGDVADVMRAADGVLGATADAYRELDGWARPRMDLPRTGELSWADRLRTLASPRGSMLVPQADRSGIASRWVERIGRGTWLARVRDETRRPVVGATGVRALMEDVRGPVVLAGTPATHVAGTVQVIAALASSLPWLAANEERGAPRLGTDRIHTHVAEALGRRLVLAVPFLVREAGVDRGQKEAVVLERLYAELFTVRRDAALAKSMCEALVRTPDLAGRFREHVRAATQSAPGPMWAAHYAARWYELRAGARTIAALAECTLYDRLRAEHDEDWFRNPRAGDTLTAAFAEMRTRGVLSAPLPVVTSSTPAAPVYTPAIAPPFAFDPAHLARRVADALTDARR